MLLTNILVSITMIKEYYIKATFRVGDSDHLITNNFKLNLDLSSNTSLIRDNLRAFLKDYYSMGVYDITLDFMIEC